jgi:hypothetical protein
VVKRLTQFRSVLLAPPHGVASTSEPPTKSIRLKEVRRSSPLRVLSRVLPVLVVLVLVAIVVASPWVEAHVFAYAARRMTFHLVHDPGVPPPVRRPEQFGPHGAVFGSKVRNRTAAFVFTIGDRFFGTVLAYADGPDAVTQSFTSSLAVQVFRELIPSLRSLLARGFENHVSWTIGSTGPLARRGLIALAVPAEDIQSSDRPPTGRKHPPRF